MCTMCSRSGRSARWMRPASSHSSHGCSAGELGLDLVVLDDAPGGGVDEEHPAGLQAALAHDPLGRDVEHADLAGEHDEAVVGHPEAAGAQAVAVERRTDERAVGEDDAAGPSHGSMSIEWNS